MDEPVTMLFFILFLVTVCVGLPAVGACSEGCALERATKAFHSEIAACNKQKMSWNRLEIREDQRGFVRCIDHRTNQTKLVPVTY